MCVFIFSIFAYASILLCDFSLTVAQFIPLNDSLLHVLFTFVSNFMPNSAFDLSEHIHVYTHTFTIQLNWEIWNTCSRMSEEEGA